MSATTGPIVAAGAITGFVAVVVHNRPLLPDAARIGVSTAIAAGGFFLFERASPALAVPMAWLALTTVLLVRLNPSIPAPAEAVADWLNKG